MSDLAEKPWRLFVAIELPPHIRKQIKDHIDHLRAEFPEVRASWSREENLHLTLKFLGDVPVARVEELSRATERAARKVNPFELAIKGCGAFPPKGQPRVLWIGIEDHSGSLARLHRALEDECTASGFERDNRAFHPHLTLARLRESTAARRLATQHKESLIAEQVISVSELMVVRSELHSEGSRHTAVVHHSLSSSRDSLG
jgi:RNA 2',3'-cyclic 3'-phosphodiesterase